MMVLPDGRRRRRVGIWGAAVAPPERGLLGGAIPCSKREAAHGRWWPSIFTQLTKRGCFPSAAFPSSSRFYLANGTSTDPVDQYGPLPEPEIHPAASTQIRVRVPCKKTTVDKCSSGVWSFALSDRIIEFFFFFNRIFRDEKRRVPLHECQYTYYLYFVIIWIIHSRVIIFAVCHFVKWLTCSN